MPRPRGFTLLELLLVVALVSLLAGIVAPRVLGWADAARARAALDELRSRLQAQPALTFHAQRPRVVAQVPDDWPLPTGWRLELAAPLRWEANGMAAPGRIRIRDGTGLLADWVLQAPGGELRPATSADGPFGAKDADGATRPGDGQGALTARVPGDASGAPHRP